MPDADFQSVTHLTSYPDVPLQSLEENLVEQPHDRSQKDTSSSKENDIISEPLVTAVAHPKQLDQEQFPVEPQHSIETLQHETAELPVPDSGSQETHTLDTCEHCGRDTDQVADIVIGPSVLSLVEARLSAWSESHSPSHDELQAVIHRLTQELQQRDIQLQRVTDEIRSQDRTDNVQGALSVDTNVIELEDTSVQSQLQQTQADLVDIRVKLQAETAARCNIEKELEERDKELKKISESLMLTDPSVIENFQLQLQEKEAEIELLKATSVPSKRLLEQLDTEERKPTETCDISMEVSQTTGVLDEVTPSDLTEVSVVKDLQSQLSARDKKVTFKPLISS